MFLGVILAIKPHWFIYWPVAKNDCLDYSRICLSLAWPRRLNRLRPRQNGRHFADDTFNRIFVNENVRISIKFPLTFVLKGPVNNIPALVLIMAWRRPGDKPLSEPMMARLPTHICVTRPQWVNWKATRLAARTAIDAKLGYQGPLLLIRVNLTPSMDT